MPELISDARDVLADGPVFEDDLVDRLVALGHDEHEVLDLLEADADEVVVWPLADGRLCDLHRLMDGVVLTHRVDPDERTAGEVELSPDLVAAHLLAPDGRHIADPTRRGDVERLIRRLEESPGPSAPGRGMSADRLRELLGL